MGLRSDSITAGSQPKMKQRQEPRHHHSLFARLITSVLYLANCAFEAAGGWEPDKRLPLTQHHAVRARDQQRAANAGVCVFMLNLNLKEWPTPRPHVICCHCSHPALTGSHRHVLDWPKSAFGF